MKLIELDALVANIKRLKNHYDSAAKEFGDEGYKDNVLMEQAKSTVCDRFLSFINTLEVKEVDLDDFIKEEFNKYSCVDGYGQLSVSYNMAEFYGMIKRLTKAQKGE